MQRLSGDSLPSVRLTTLRNIRLTAIVPPFGRLDTPRFPRSVWTVRSLGSECGPGSVTAWGSGTGGAGRAVLTEQDSCGSLGRHLRGGGRHGHGARKPKHPPETSPGAQ